MTRLTSELVIQLHDRVSANAKRAAENMGAITRKIREMNAAPIKLGTRLDAAIGRNNMALDRARMRMVDATAGYYALTRAIRSPVAAATELGSSMADINKVVDFESSEALKVFKGDLIDLSKRIPVATKGLAEIAAAAGQNNIAKEDILPFTEAAAKISVAFDRPAQEIGVALSKIKSGLGLTMDQAFLLADAMNHLSNNQASTAGDLLKFDLKVAAMGKKFGFATEKTVAFGSAMIAAGFAPEVAATSFLNMGRALTAGEAATKAQRDAYKALGLDAKKVAKQMQVDAESTTLAVMARLSKLAPERQAAISSLLFGNEARALGPLLTNTDLLRESLALVADEAKYSGSAFKEFDVRNSTFGSEVQRFKNAANELNVAIGDALLPSLSDLMERLKPLLQFLSDAANRFPRVTSLLFQAAGGFVALKVATAGLSFIGLMGKGGALSLMALGLKGVGRTAGGIANAATEMVALQSALAAMEGKQIGKLSRMKFALKGIATAVPGVVPLTGIISGIGGALAAISLPVWIGFAAAAAAVAAAGVTIYKHWDAISSYFAGVGAALQEHLQPAFDAIKPVLDWFAPLGETISNSWKGVKDIFAGSGEWFSGLFEQNKLTDDEKAAYKQSGEDLVDAIFAGFGGLGERIENFKASWSEAGREGMNSLKQGFQNKFADVKAWIDETFVNIGTWFDMEAWKQAGADMINALWDGMKQVFIDLKNWLGDQLNSVGDMASNALSNVPLVGRFVGGDNPDANSGASGSWDARAGGGPISRGQTYMVGEKGPELITANRNGYVHPTGLGVRPAPVAVTVNSTVNLNGSSSDPSQIGHEVARHIREQVQEAFRGLQSDTGMRFA